MTKAHAGKRYDADQLYRPDGFPNLPSFKQIIGQIVIHASLLETTQLALMTAVLGVHSNVAAAAMGAARSKQAARRILKKTGDHAVPAAFRKDFLDAAEKVDFAIRSRDKIAHAQWGYVHLRLDRGGEEPALVLQPTDTEMDVQVALALFATNPESSDAQDAYTTAWKSQEDAMETWTFKDFEAVDQAITDAIRANYDLTKAILRDQAAVRRA